MGFCLSMIHTLSLDRVLGGIKLFGLKNGDIIFPGFTTGASLCDCEFHF